MSFQSDSARIDSICDLYESQWRTGLQPDIDRLLDRVDPFLQPRLMHELLALEAELLSAPQATANRKKYRERYPAIFEQIASTIESLEARQEEADIPTHIGPYRILQRLGEGGMGTVYMAEQDVPVRRRVAVKVIRSGDNSKQVIARFEAERQALAMMEHPSIARILDAGTTEAGMPFFAMELVRGIDLISYCDRRRLCLRQRIELFCQVCDGVHHAHQKGIIHRDLKPTNILVGDFENEPVAKIIDFGLAKALDVSRRLTNRTMFTEYGQVIGTAKYMSPEQAGLDALDVDTRSDIYTLGVILYELLTGATPLDDANGSEEALFQILKRVREQEPVRPSIRLSSDRHSLEEVTRLRRTDSRWLLKSLRGDLDWIVVKALEKDRKRRYQSAAELGQDLKNYLSNDPVLARPPSRSYQLKKLAKRHRVLAGSILAIVLILTAATAICLTLVFRLDELRKDAVQANLQLSLAKQEVEGQRDVARSLLESSERNRARAERQERLASSVLDFLQNRILRQANIYEQANDQDPAFVKQELTLLDALRRTVNEFSPDQMEQRFPGETEIQASLLETMAEIFSSVGEHADAVRFSESAESIRRRKGGGSVAGDILANQVNRVFILLTADRHAEAAEMAGYVLNELHSILQRAEDSPANASDPLDEVITKTVDAMASRLSPKHIVLPRIQIESLGPFDKMRIAATLAVTIPRVSQVHELMERRYGVDDHRSRYTLMLNGFIDHFAAEALQHTVSVPGYNREELLDRAIDIYEQILVFCERNLPDNDLRLAGIEMVLSVAYEDKFGDGDDRAFACHQKAAAICREKLHAEHPANILIDRHVASGLAERNQLERAIALWDSIVERQKRVFGTGDSGTISAMQQLADCHLNWASEGACPNPESQLDQAIRIYREILQLQISADSLDSADAASTAHDLGQALMRAKRYDQAQTTFEQALVYRQKNWLKTPAEAFSTLGWLASSHERQKAWDQAEQTLDQLTSLYHEYGLSGQHPLIRLAAWRKARIANMKGDTQKLQQRLDQLGLETLFPFQLVVNEQEQPLFWDTVVELKQYPHNVIDLEVFSEGNKVDLILKYELSESPRQYTWFRKTPTSEFESLHARQSSGGFVLSRKIQYSIGDKSFVASLWHKEPDSE